MKAISAGKAKNGFGLLIDTARAEPVTIRKHGRPVAVVLSAEEYERLKNIAGEPVNEAPVTLVEPHRKARQKK